MKVLVTHQFDRPMRCMIDPAVTLEMFKHQMDEVIRLEASEAVPPVVNASDRTEEEMWDLESSILGTELSSTAGKTDITTGTGATPIVANRDKYALTGRTKRKYRTKVERFRILEESTTAKQLPGPLSRSQETSSSTHAMDQKSQHNSNTHDKPNGDSSSFSSYHGVIPRSQLPPGVQPAVIGCGSIFTSLSSRRYSALREDYGRVLHLKVKSSAAKYFWCHYLKQFPQSPVPESVDLVRSSSSFSGISRAWTDSSISLPDINYGDHVYASPVQMMLGDSDFLDLGLTGSLGLIKCFEVSETGERLKSPNHYKILLNRRSGVPLAVCALRSPNESPVVRIFAIKPRMYGQKPVATTEQLGLTWCQPYPLYPWAEFTAEGNFPDPARYNLYLSTGFGRFEKQPSYRAVHETVGSPEVLVLGKTEHERELTGSALLTLQTNEELDYSSVSVARGVDPALMICFTAILDEILEHNMRRHVSYNKGQQQRS